MMPYPYTIGGGTTYLNDLIRSLLKKGHEIHVITSNASKEMIKNNPETPAEINIHRIGLPHKKFGRIFLPLDIIYRALFEIIFMIALLTEIRKLKPDVIHTQTLLSESLPLVLFRIPFVVTVYGIHIEGFKEVWNRKKNKIAVLLSLIYKLMEEFTAKHCRLMIICTTKRTDEYYSHFGKTILMGSGISFLEFTRKYKKQRNLYLTLSRLSEQKGLNYLLDALEILDRKRIKINFIVAGDGEKEFVDNLKNRANKLKNIKVEFVGWVSGEQKKEIYGKSSVFVMPSVFEPFGITLLEAMASECAIISSECEGPINTVKSQFGELVPYDDEKKRAKNLAETIEKSLKWNTKSMGKKARKEAEKYDYDKIVDRYLKVYEENRIK